MPLTPADHLLCVARNVRASFRVVAVAAGLLVAIFLSPRVHCWAQDDPFGTFDDTAMDAGGLFGDPGSSDDLNLGGAAAPDAVAGETDLRDDPLRDQLIEQSRRGNELLAASVRSLSRIGRWSDVDQLLSGLNVAQISPAKAAAMAARIGPDAFFQIKQQPEVSEKARANLDRLGTLLREQNASPERLNKAIAALDSTSMDDRFAAARVLLSGGDAAIAALVAAAVTQRTSQSRAEILRVLVRLGDGGIEALRQLALYGNADVRTRALASLSRVDADKFVIEAVSALHAIHATDAERAIAAGILSRVAAAPPSRSEAVAFLYDDLEIKRQLATTAENTYQTRTIWIVAAAGDKVSPQLTDELVAIYRGVADAGARLRRIRSGSDPATATAIDVSLLSASLAYRVIIDPDWGDRSQVADVLNVIAAHVDTPENLESTILTAIKLAAGDDRYAVSGESSHAGDEANVTDVAAMIGLIRFTNALVNGQLAGVTLDIDPLIRSGGGSPTALVQQATSSNPQIRYEAALLVHQLADRSAYPGSSRVRGTLAEMTRLGDRPTAIVVETRPGFAAHFDRLIAGIGWDTMVVGSVAELTRAVQQGGDLRLILSKTQLADLAPIEMIDVVRRLPRGGEVPIVFYDDDGIRGKVNGDGVFLGGARWTAPATIIDPPATADGLAAVVDQVRRRERVAPLSVFDRQRFRSESLKLLSPPNE